MDTAAVESQIAGFLAKYTPAIEAQMQVRGVRFREPGTINTPEVEALIAQAVGARKSEFLAAPVLTTIVKSVSAKQRPRRPTAD